MSVCLEKIKKSLKDNEAALICSPTNRRYLTGFNSSAGNVIITKNKAVLLIDFRYFEAAQQQVNNMDVCLLDNKYKDISAFLAENKINVVFAEIDFLSVADFKILKKELGIKISRSEKIAKILNKSRRIKNDDEIQNIKAAQSIADKTFEHILGKIKTGITEKEIMLELEFFMRKLGSEGVAFDTIAVSGKNTSLPHGVPTDKKIEKGDFITMDFGAVINGYRSDITRTVAVGSVGSEQRKIYNTVLCAQQTALEKISSGKICSDIDKSARDVINNAGFKGCFGHALGHSVGLDIHESPNFSPNCSEVLKENMVITVEPGIYLPNKFGVRIEDMIIVKNGGCENITKSAKELIVL